MESSVAQQVGPATANLQVTKGHSTRRPFHRGRNLNNEELSIEFGRRKQRQFRRADKLQREQAITRGSSYSAFQECNSRLGCDQRQEEHEGKQWSNESGDQNNTDATQLEGPTLYNDLPACSTRN